VTAEAGASAGPLNGLRIVELASEWTAFAGKLLGDLGADVLLVEPPQGAPTRRFGPFADDQDDPENGLWWWYYQTSKYGVTLSLDDSDGRAAFGELVAAADIVLEGEIPGRLAALGVDHGRFRAAAPGLVWVSITPFGSHSLRSTEPATDLTILAGGGPVWSCGYDDHHLPPVRGGGNQAAHTAGLHAVIATLAAIVHRDTGGPGQHVDVSMHAAVNVTTEAATYHWLVAKETVQRQTCRHASHNTTSETMAYDVRGRAVNTGVPPRSAAEYQQLIEWLSDLGLLDDYPEAFFLQLGVERGGTSLAEARTPGEAQAIFGAGREALRFIASRLTDYDFFIQGQQRGLAVGLIYAPEEVIEDRHFVERGFPVPVFQPTIARSVIHPGAPLRFERSPWAIRRSAPTLGQHNDQFLKPPGAATPDVDGATPGATSKGTADDQA
jgi:crotonobetainyl-CoA:carnitine CoA-transferase CaiB-like acyl-CoA transferase